MEEVWKPITGYEGLYEVSNLGEIRSLDRIIINKSQKEQTFKGKILAKIKDKDGYVRSRISKDSKVKNVFIHRIVSQEFNENPLNKPCVNHKDGVKDNNISTNLEWSTYEENEKHKREILKKGIGELIHNSKLKNSDILDIRKNDFGKY